MPKHRKTLGETVGTRFKNISMYDNEFETNYRGVEMFKTIHGACFSIFIVLIILNRGLMAGDRLVNKKDPEKL
jgi:hypothetical protein